MLLCSYSSKLVLDGYTVLDNRFLNEFLPQATGEDVKVYLFGLSLCSNPIAEENNLDTISRTLSLTEEQVVKSFSYWQDAGLVQIASKNPLQIKYLPVRSNSGSLKIRNKSKFSDFNKQMQEVISGRMITPAEFNEYYTLIETYHFEPEAVLLIAKYCTSLKGGSINYAYILAVARSFAEEGLKTFETVEEKFLEQERSSKELKSVLSALKIKRDSDIEERNCYIKWTTKLGFTHGVIVEVAKTIKSGGVAKLDEILTKYFELKLLTMEEIEEFSSQRENLFEIAKAVSKNLGLYYGDYETVVNNYVVDWANKGYGLETLMFLSNYCFKQSIRTLEGFNITLQKFYKLGLVTLPSIEKYIDAVLLTDEKIKEVLATAGLERNVTAYDRDCYKMWTENWGYLHDQILLVSSNFKDKTNPISYINRVLANLHEQGAITTKQIEEKLKANKELKGLETKTKSENNFETRNYSHAELSAVFDSLDDVEI